MRKHVLIAATAALLALPSLSSTVLAAPSEASEDTATHHPKFSGRGLRSFHGCAYCSAESRPQTDSGAGKELAALETALREQAKARAARIAEWREKAKEPREHRSVIEGLQQGAKRLAARSAELEKLADAAKPLFDSLDDAQKGRFRALLHIATGRHWHHGYEGFRHG